MSKTPLRAFVSSCETQKEEAKPAPVPKLRFPEFRGTVAWKPSILADACDMQAGKFVSASNICERNRGGLFPCYGGNGLRGYTTTYTHDGTYPLIGRQGALCGNVRLVSGQFQATEHAVVATPTRAIDVGWLHYSLDLLNLNRFATGQAQPGLSIDVLNNVPLAIPPLKAEQQKIADCLTSLDELIAAQARKVDALKTHKKGLMQQLFPREGETQPRLRFPEFQNAGEWKSDQLGVVCELYQPVTLSSSELSMTGEYLVYGANGVIGTHNEYNHEDSEIAVTCRGATCGEVTTTKPKSWITGNAMVVKPRNKKMRKDFIFHYFKNHGLKTVISGSAQPQITRTGFAPLVIFFPEPDEQQRIASCLSSLDALITAETQRMEVLKTHKKGLMQQLFPLPAAGCDT